MIKTANYVYNYVCECRRYIHVKTCIKRRNTGQKLFPNKKFCIIYRWAENTGIYSHITTCLSALYWAEEQGLVPVFDTRDVPNMHKPNDRQDWYELFFDTPAGYSIDDVSNAKNYIVVDAEKLYDSIDVKVDNTMQFLKKKDLLTKLRNVYRKYIHVNEMTERYIDFMWEKVTGKQENSGFLGVRCRGTGYNIVHAEGLSTVTSVDIISLVKQAMKGGGMNKIFLATDDTDIISLFEAAFDEDILFFLEEEDRISTSDVEKEIECGEDIWIAQVEAMKKKTSNLYMHNLNYITEIMLLTKCEGIISNKCSAGLCLPIMKTDWKYELYI